MNRIAAIDSCRGLAVVLAMFGHATNQFAGNIEISGAIAALQLLFTRTATPTFMILFGIMIELVYLRALRAGAAVDPVRRRLLSRMLTCFVLFALIALAAMVTGKLAPPDTLEAVLFLGPGRFGNVLKIYTGLFLLIVVTLPFAIRWGSRFYLGLAALAWAMKYALDALGVPGLHLVHFVFGHDIGFGPAILLGVTLLAYGMMIGEALSGRGGLRAPALMLAAAVAILAWGLAAGDPVDFVLTTITEYRWTNAPQYFAYGIAACSASLAWFALLWRGARGPAPALSFDSLGRDTLFYYGFGNILLNLLPVHSGTGAGAGYLCIALFLAALTAIALTRDRLYALADRLLLHLPAWIAARYARFDAAATAWLLRLFGGAPRAAETG